MATANGVSSSSHVTELTYQVIEALLVNEFSSETTSLGLSCLLRALVRLSSASGSASQVAMDTLLSLLPHSTGRPLPLLPLAGHVTSPPGRQLEMVCDSLVAIAATTRDRWSEVASSLTQYLTKHSDQLSLLLV